VICTAALRFLITLPAQTTSQKVAAKRYLLKKEMDEKVIPALKHATNRHVAINKWSEEKAKFNFRRVSGDLWREKVIEYNCHFSKLFLPLYIQIPVWLFSSVSLRNLSTMRGSDLRLESVPMQERFIQMSSEGMMWFPNLTVPDSSLLLPMVVGCSFAANIFISQRRLQANQMDEKMAKNSRVITYLIYTFAAVMVPLAAFQPTSLALYWATSGLSGTAINLLLLSPKYRYLVKIPKTPLDSKTPYLDVKNRLLDIFKSNK